MPKQLLKDIIPLKRERREVKDFSRREPELDRMREVFDSRNISMDKSRKPRWIIWIIAIISIIFLFFALSFLFAKAEVIVNPKLATLNINENLSADKDSATDGLSFDLVVISGDDTKTLQATAEKDVSQKAIGTVILYNAFSASPQPLTIDTRLEGSNGKIYKTLKKVVIPGVTKAGLPGSIEMQIYGSEAGVDYNSTPLDFKIFGFKGTPKYAKVYARSKGDISGGYIGKAPVIADTDKATALSGLKDSLQAKLLKKASDQIPAGFVLFKDAIFLNTDDSNISSVYNKDNSATFTEKGTLYGLLFNEQKLTDKIATDSIDKYDGSSIYIQNIKDLTFTLANKDAINFSSAKNINFNLTGSAKFVYRLDLNKFTTDLLGKSKSEFNQILAQYSNIDSATLTLSPLWKTSIPDEGKDLKITVNYPK